MSLNNADLPAFPQPEHHDAGKFMGLSKLEWLSGMVMQAVISSGNHVYLTPEYSTKNDLAGVSIAIAQKLLSELEKTKSKP